MEQTACGLVHQLVRARLQARPRGEESLIHPIPKEEPIHLIHPSLLQLMQRVRRGLR
jgi:hypothetical protein